jgi:hypothetical protein
MIFITGFGREPAGWQKPQVFRKHRGSSALQLIRQKWCCYWVDVCPRAIA